MTTQRYVKIMRFLGVLYAVVGLIFFFFPTEVFYLINIGPKVFGLGQAVPDPSEYFWLVLATAMMAMLTAVSFLAASRPKERGYAWVHILSKCVSVAGFIYMFIVRQHFFAYLVGVVTDLPLAVLVAWCVMSLRDENSAAPAAAGAGAAGGAASGMEGPGR